ncbi:hypothetical protein BD65_1890 [Yersinia ruckeri]|uniref:DUF5405 family protein n=1 Tax=Yersinia ruckeri TaxID=29486 RepID=UPI0005AD410F|nr:DUF5405 family protein [Yersinia ruckeri]AJI95501.1 hypothetical protein BD65_1890 [Yersinia ruckeri]CNB91174.1 Uncharacterised protein [Yersinia ruckeri]
MKKELKWVFINNWFAVAKGENDTFILADIRVDKESGKTYYLTRAVYSETLNLIADITSLCVKRCVYLKTITTPSALMRESHHFNELSQKALIQLDSQMEATPCQI